MPYCGGCRKETKSNYLIREIGILCGSCAGKHIEKEISSIYDNIENVGRED